MSDQNRILVIDDESVVLISVDKILSREGYEVVTADKAEDGLEKAKGGGFDLVITDLMMPGMNGIELMHSIKTTGSDVPFLMITGYPSIKTAMQALRLGAIDYIPKPFTRVELISPVNRALRRRGMPERTRSPEAKSSAGPVMPGDCFVLPEHSWGLYEQEGTVAVGIEGSFLESAGRVSAVEAPADNEMIEQGYPFLKLRTEEGDEHAVFAPFSGRVVAVNREALDDPVKMTATSWLVRIIPSQIHSETEALIRREERGE